MSGTCIRCILKGRTGNDLLCDDCRELGKLRQELARMDQEVLQAYARSAVDRKIADKLREACKPFVNLGIPDNWPQECVLTWHYDTTEPAPNVCWLSYCPASAKGGPTIGDYRRLEAALKGV